VAHKDYTGATPIQISVYRDKIMIWNYGELPEDWTMDDLLKKHSSRPYNPDIANAFFRIGYIESWGRGMDKMKKQCIEANLPVPTISVKGHDFWIVFRKDIYFPEYLNDLGLNERQTDALIYFKSKGEITSSEYAQKYNITDRTARTDLNELIEKELLTKKGETNQSKYLYL
jgi:ATP-dependent DNA helicase RecG